MSLLHVFEERLAPAQNEGIDHQLELIDQTQIHQTGYQRGAADNVHVLARLLLYFSDLFRVPDDPCCLPCDLVQCSGKDNMRRLIAQRA
jgi:hypothetical protein